MRDLRDQQVQGLEDVALEDVLRLAVKNGGSVGPRDVEAGGAFGVYSGGREPSSAKVPSGTLRVLAWSSSAIDS
jgi:hypothetical protein